MIAATLASFSDFISDIGMTVTVLCLVRERDALADFRDTPARAQRPL
jgi:hypothetical protein